MNALLAERPVERARVAYEGHHLPAFRMVAHPQRGVIVAHGDFDSFVEEFIDPLGALPALGYTVIAFDRPGQGSALYDGLAFTERWEAPAAAVLITSASTPSTGSVSPGAGCSRFGPQPMSRASRA